MKLKAWVDVYPWSQEEGQSKPHITGYASLELTPRVAKRYLINFEVPDPVQFDGEATDVKVEEVK